MGLCQQLIFAAVCPNGIASSIVSFHASHPALNWTVGSYPTMTVDEVDRELERAERDASPERFQRDSNEIERAITGSSTSTGSSRDSNSPYRTRVGMSRVSTQADLERHPTELSRIATARSQHTATVGRSLKSRESKKPLPAFGAGKDYPPQLPAREEYVVEFDGPGDPYHSQNWPFRKK